MNRKHHPTTLVDQNKEKGEPRGLREKLGTITWKRKCCIPKSLEGKNLDLKWAVDTLQRVAVETSAKYSQKGQVLHEHSLKCWNWKNPPAQREKEGGRKKERRETHPPMYVTMAGQSREAEEVDNSIVSDNSNYSIDKTQRTTLRCPNRLDMEADEAVVDLNPIHRNVKLAGEAVVCR